MTTDLMEKLDALGPGTDYTDAATYSFLDDDGEDGAPTPDAQTADDQAALTEQPQGVEVNGAEPEHAAPVADDQAPAAKVDGVLTRDGKHVIPFAVLEAERKSKDDLQRQLAEERAARQKLVDDIEAAKATKEVADKDASRRYSAEEIEEAAVDFPVMARMMTQQNELIDELSGIRTAVTSTKAQAAESDEDAGRASIQSDIDVNPLLAEWQAEGGSLWAQAVKLDAVLLEDPKWANKPRAERFAAVQKGIAATHGITPIHAPEPQAEPVAAKKTPATQTVQEVMPTLSDFGGRAAAAKDEFAADMPVGQMYDKAMSMDMSAIRRMVGIDY